VSLTVFPSRATTSNISARPNRVIPGDIGTRRFIISSVFGGLSGPSWCQQLHPTGILSVTSPARSYAMPKDSIGPTLVLQLRLLVRASFPVADGGLGLVLASPSGPSPDEG
jgi:hypothetical protein